MKKNNMKKPMILLAVAAILLVVSTVGSTQAALTYRSEDYIADVSVAKIGVSLLENDNVIGQRDYTEEGAWSVAVDDLLKDTAENVTPGYDYPEVLKVKNTGEIDTYVRVIITKHWEKEGVKSEDHDISYIKLNAPASSTWVKDTENSRADGEREIYYYTGRLAHDELTDPLTTTFEIDSRVTKELTQTTDANNIITYTYDYDGCTFVVNVEVQAVQARNAQDAIKSAWGIDVTVEENGTLKLGAPKV